MSVPFKTLRLHSFQNSSASWRARFVLKWKKIDYEYVAVNTVAGHQHKPEYKKINPLNKIPALKLTGRI